MDEGVNHFTLQQPPEKILPKQCQSSLTRFFPYLHQRWQEGCHNRAQLLTELWELGYAIIWQLLFIEHYHNEWLGMVS